MRTIVVGPSFLGYVLAECERCAVRQIVHGVKRPGTVDPIYNIADGAMKAYFERDRGEVVHDLGVGPTFTVLSQGLAVRSLPLSFADLGIELVVAGKLDALVRTSDDETYVVDYKTAATPKIDVRTYEWQLHAYAHALEHPQNPNAGAVIDGLALLVNRPATYGVNPRKKVSGMGGPTEWLEVPRNDRGFLALLRRIAELAAERILPVPNPDCAFCRYYGAIPLAISGAA